LVSPVGAGNARLEGAIAFYADMLSTSPLTTGFRRFGFDRSSVTVRRHPVAGLLIHATAAQCQRHWNSVLRIMRLPPTQRPCPA
jgi:hypothetical protein